jgi:hypothetical protein
VGLYRRSHWGKECRKGETMNPENVEFIKTVIAVLIAVVMFAMLMMLQGCASVHVERAPDGTLVADYSKFLTKMDQPEFTVIRDGDSYSVSFNAAAIDESGSAATLSGAVGDVLRQGGAISATIPDRN